jgi:hypothetical protein
MRLLVPIVFFAFPLAATAQSSPVQVPTYISALDGYRFWSQESVAPAWRQVNDEVGQLQGHAGHLQRRPAATTSPSVVPAATRPPLAPPAAAPAPASGHAGHHGGMQK